MPDRRLDELTEITSPALTDLVYVEADPGATKVPRKAQLTNIIALAPALNSGRLTKSGATLLFSPYRGNTVVVNGTSLTIPDAGITLAVGATLTEGGTPAASTLYYIYAYNSSGSPVLQASATGHATQAGTGREIRTGDATRTLVGMARTTAGVAWTDNHVLSYFNRRRIGRATNFTTPRTTTSATYVELNSEIRNDFLTWSDEAVDVAANGGVITSGGAQINTAIGFDGTNQENSVSMDAQVTVYGSMSLHLVKSGLAEGYHYVTLLGATGGGQTGTWGGGTYTADTTARAICSITVGVQG